MVGFDFGPKYTKIGWGGEEKRWESIKAHLIALIPNTNLANLTNLNMESIKHKSQKTFVPKKI